MIIHMHANLNTIVVLGHLKTIIFFKFKMKKKKWKMKYMTVLNSSNYCTVLA